MNKDDHIYVAGHTGLLGGGLVRVLRDQGYANLITRTHDDLELTDRRAVDAFFQAERPKYVFLAAARVGGIYRNRTYPAEMIHVNLAIQDNVIDAAYQADVKGFLFVGSACAYPRECEMPIRPESLLAGPPEATNAPFALAKIAGISMCRAYNAQYGMRFLSVIPATLYGPGDHFDANGHVVAALMARFHQAKISGSDSVAVWGTGTPRREFLYVDDAAEAMIFLMNGDGKDDLINIGGGEDMSIAKLATAVAGVVGYEGTITFDTSKPDGMLRRLLDSAQIRQLGWRPRTPLIDGLRRTYTWYVEQVGGGRLS